MNIWHEQRKFPQKNHIAEVMSLIAWSLLIINCAHYLMDLNKLIFFLNFL